MKKLALALGLIMIAAVSLGQVLPNLPANTVFGRLGVGAGPGQAIPFSTLAGNLLLSLSGDVNCSASGICAIANGAVTGAKTATNTIANSNLAQAGANTLKGNFTGGTANEADNAMPSCSTATGALQYTSGTGFSCGTFQPAPSQITASLGGDVNLNNVSNYFDGPSIAQGSTGTWWTSGHVTITETSTAIILCKLHDGTTVIDSAVFTIPANTQATAHLSGYLASPAGNLRISCKDQSDTTGVMKANASGNSKDSTVSAFRIQ